MTDDRTSPRNESRAREQVRAMLSRARGARSEVEQARASATGSQALDIAAILSSITGAENQLETAESAAGFTRAIDLPGLENLLTSIERAADNAVQAAASSASTAGNASPEAVAHLAAVTAETRRDVQEVSDDIFKKKIFDRWLDFDSDADKAAYEARSAEREREIDAELAKKTPQGALNANAMTIDQMMDAHANGAGNSPDFMPNFRKGSSAWHKTIDAKKAAGLPIDDDERRMRDKIRTRLEQEGVPPNKIAQILADPDSLRAVDDYYQQHPAAAKKAAIAEEPPAHGFEDPPVPHPWSNGAVSSAQIAKTPVPEKQPSPQHAMTAPTTAATPSTDSVAAAKAAIVATDFTADEPTTPNHGLPDQPKSTAKPSGRGIG